MNTQQIENILVNIANQLSGVTGQMDKAPDYIRRKLYEKVNYNLPLLQEGAALAEKLYTLPGELMRQYMGQFGSVFGGASGMERLNSILRNLGRQAGLVDLADKLAAERRARLDQMANDLTKQYGLAIEALQNKYNIWKDMWQRQFAKEQAARRYAAARAAAASSALRFPLLNTALQEMQKKMQEEGAQQNQGELTNQYVGKSNFKFIPWLINVGRNIVSDKFGSTGVNLYDKAVNFGSNLFKRLGI